MSAMDLRPLSLGELLDRTFSIYRKRIGLFVGIMVLPETVLVAVRIGFQRSIGSMAFFGAMGDPKQATAPNPEMLLRFFVAMFGISIVAFFAYTIALGATTLAVSDVYLGRSTSIGAAYSKMRAFVGRLLGMNLLVALAIGSAFFVVVVVAAILGAAMASVSPALIFLVALLSSIAGSVLAFWLFLGFSISVPALLLENSRIFAALKRSLRLVRGNRGRVFVIMLVMIFMMYIVVFVCQAPMLIFVGILMGKGQQIPFWLMGMSTVLGGVGAMFTGPLMMIALALFYYDVRVRKEAFDLQMIMSSLDAPPVPASPPAAPVGR